ncbi:MAG: hypothetical protein HFE73_10555 [Firmicutes bacterium]|nr:hypothetical protein [Bacillota bacterium]
MKEKRMIVIKKSQLPYAGKEELLASSVCPAVFPANVVMEEEQLRIFYETEGWQPLARREQLDAVEFLTLMNSVLQNMEKMRGWLLFPEEYVLSEQTVYIPSGFFDEINQVRFIYIPDGQKISAAKRMGCFLYGLREKLTENSMMYLEMLTPLLTIENLDTKRLLIFLDNLLTEAYVCKIR